MTSSTHTLLLKLFVLGCTIICVSNCHQYATTGDDFSVGVVKYYFYNQNTLCNGTRIENGIYSESKYWVDCLNVGSKGDESYINAVWRVYTCVLAKYKDDGTQTISLLEFSQIITTSYPDEIKKSINDLVKSLGETKGKENSWLTSKIKFTDYSNVDKIRAQYYDIEKAVCKNETDLLLSETLTLKSWDKCSLHEENNFRGSDCCGNNTLPFGRYHHDSPSQLFNATSCERTLKSGLGQLLENNSTKGFLLGACEFTCYLVENSFMTIVIDELRKLKMDERQIRLIVNATYPYIPIKTQETLVEQMVATYNETIVTERVNILVQYFNITIVAEEEKSFLHSCEAITGIQFQNPFYEMACPETVDGRVMNYAIFI